LGARHIITLSRSGTDAKHVYDLLKEMRNIEVEVTVIKGDVTDPGIMREVQTLSGERPVRGIIQAATSSKVNYSTTTA
jgi:hypothetical protein